MYHYTESTLRKLLRRRGVFISDTSKTAMAPYLIKTGLSPNEYNILVETYKSKESQLKSRIRSIPWQTKTDLIDAIPNNFDYNSLLDEHLGTCKLVSIPQFTTLNNSPNHIQLDFEIERTNPTKNLGENKTYHNGRLELKKEDAEMQVSMILNHTSRETDNYVKSLTSKMVKHFKSTGDIDNNESMLEIKFYDFDNKNRIQFLKALSEAKKHEKLNFIDTKNIKVCLDDSKSNYPNEIEWMRDRIDKMNLDGKELHQTVYLKNNNLFEYLLLFGITCTYHFENDDFNANCNIEYIFSNRKDLLEGSELSLEISVSEIQTNNSNKISKSIASKVILDSLEKFKIEYYKQYKNNT